MVKSLSGSFRWIAGHVQRVVPTSPPVVVVVIAAAAAAAAGSSAPLYKPRPRNKHAAHQPGIQSYRALRRKRAGMKLNGTVHFSLHLKIRKKDEAVCRGAAEERQHQQHKNTAKQNY